MNRIRASAPSFSALQTPSPAAAETEYAAALAVARTGDEPITLFGPVHYERNYAYPLIVWLHGAGHTERQLTKIMPLVSLRNYVAVAPRGPVRPLGGRRGTGSAGGFTWSQRPGDLAEAERRVFEAIDVARLRYHTAERRVFLIGADAGGSVALRLALLHADRFAGAASLGGPFPRGGAPLARLAQARLLPLLLAHGRDDAAFAEDVLAEQLRLFHAAGMNVVVRQYPGGAGLAPSMLADVDRWLMDLVTGRPAAAS